MNRERQGETDRGRPDGRGREHPEGTGWKHPDTTERGRGDATEWKRGDAMGRERRDATNESRRAFLGGVASAVAVAVGVGSATASKSGTNGRRGATGGRGGAASERGDAANERNDATGESGERVATVDDDAPLARALRQEVNTSLTPGVTLFDLSGDGAYTATVERAAPESSGRSDAIHVSSGGSSTVDYAASVVEPPSGTTLGGLSDLSYDYYEGPDNVNPDASGGGFAPDETFLVVENADGRHGVYLTYNDGGGGSGPGEEWRTFDVLARIGGDTGGTSGWFEYTEVEDGYSGRTFDSVVGRFGEDAQLVRVGVGHGNAVNPATLDLYYDSLVVDGQTLGFPSNVVKRTS